MMVLRRKVETCLSGRFWAVVAILVFVVAASVIEGRMITCVCTTAYCLSQGMPTCKAKSTCFAQIIHHRGQSPEHSPITRGCISGKAPLLCQAKKPRVEYEKWPYLLCCSRNLCNQDLTPTVPSMVDSNSTISTTASSTTTAPVIRTTTAKKMNTLSYDDLKMFADNLRPRQYDSKHQQYDPADIITPLNPLSVGVLALGLTLILSVGALGIYILKKQSSLARQQRQLQQLHQQHRYLASPYDVPATAVTPTAAAAAAGGGGGGGILTNRLLLTADQQPASQRRLSSNVTFRSASSPSAASNNLILGVERDHHRHQLQQLDESLEPLAAKIHNNNCL